jgi:methionyl-tRNA formyltransferase
MRIVFFGTPEFAAHSLEKIVNEGFNVVAVITAPDKPAGRGRQLKSSEVKNCAIKLNIPVLQPTNLKSSDFIDDLTKLNVDLGVVIAFRMLPEAVWSAPKLGTINLHASLLPNYRGAAPIQHAIIQGETITGVTTFFLKHEIDTGDLIDQEEVKIDLSDSGGALHDKLMDVGADLMIQSLNKIASLGKDVPTFPQVYHENLKTASKLNRDFCHLNLSETTLKIHNKVRGLCPYPSAWIESPWGELKILETEFATIDEQFIGNDLIFVVNKKLYLKCSDGQLNVKMLQPQGKSRMDASSFINGLRLQ